MRAYGPREFHWRVQIMIKTTRNFEKPFDEALSARAQEIGTQLGGTMTKDDALRLSKKTMRHVLGPF
jgi:hypothetical protein